MQRYLLAAVCAVCAGVPAVWSAVWAEEISQLDPFVVSASFTPVPESRVGSSVTVITREEIEQRQLPFVTDLLRSVPGLSVSRNGGVGKQTAIRLRGAEADQTLVLIDGIEVGDPARGQTYDFAELLSSDIDRIEVLRGQQSSIWGADAVGGVINITTRRSTGGLRLGGHAQAGSFGTFEGGAYFSGGDDHYHFAARGTAYDTRGTNVARQGGERDGYTNGTVSFVGGVMPHQAVELTFAGRHTDATSQTDVNTDPLTGLATDTDSETNLLQNYGRAQANVDLFSGHWQHEFGAAITDTDNHNFLGGIETDANNGEKFKLDYQTNLFFDTPRFARAEHTLTFLVEREYEQFEQRGTPSPFFDPNVSGESTHYGYAGEYRLSLREQLFLSGAVRHDDNELFEDATTWRVTAAYVHPQLRTKVRGSYGTAVKNPTLTELFGFGTIFGTDFVGNPALQPEESEGWEIGVEQPLLADRLRLGVTYFNATLENEIDGFFFDPTLPPFGAFTSVNLMGESERQGVEVTAEVYPFDALTVIASYTCTDSTQPDTTTLAQAREIRRPVHQASVVTNYRFLDNRANVNLAVDFQGERDDFFFNPLPPFDQSRVTLDSYTLVTFAASYALHRNVEIFGRVENLLDEDYEEVLGFATPGIAGFAGLRIGLDL